MGRILVAFFFSVCTAQAQVILPTDTLPTRWLSTITIQSTKEVDTLQRFLLANKAIATEEMLSKLQGVSLIRRGSYAQEPMVQGMTSGQVNLTIDGMKMFGACTDKMDPVSIYIEPQNLESISVQTGAQGSRVGSTVGGSIDMHLVEPEFSEQIFKGTGGLSYQSISSGLTAFTSGNYSKRTKAINYSLNYRKANNYKAGGGEEIGYTQYEKVNFTLGGKWKTLRGTWYATLLADDGWNIGFASLPMDVGYAKARIASLEYEHSTCHGLLSDWSAKVYYNSVKHSMDDSQRDDIVMHMDMPGESRTAGTYWNAKTQAVGKHVFNFRADFFYNQVLAEMVMYPENGNSMYMQTWPSSARADMGFYVGDTYTISRTTKLNTSIRWDAAGNFLHKGIGFEQARVFDEVKQHTFQDAKSFAVGMRKQMGKISVVEGNVAYSDRLPSLSELYGFYLFNRNDGYDYIGNPQLETEKSASSDLRFSFFLRNSELTLSGFYKQLHDYIFPEPMQEVSPMTPGANGVRKYKNIATANMWGGDFMLLSNLGKKTQVVTSLKWVRGIYAENKNLPLIPPLTATIALKFFPIKWISIQAECDAAAKQNNYNAEFGEDATPAYSVYHLRIQQESTKKKLSVACGVENLLDKKYHAHLDWGNIPRPGRNFYINLSYNF